MNDFLYVDSAYLLQHSIAVGSSSFQPVAAGLPPRESYDVCNCRAIETPMRLPSPHLALASMILLCCSTKTQVTPGSALKRPKTSPK